MKKFFVMLAALIACASLLCACGSENAPSETDPVQTTSQPEPETTPPTSVPPVTASPAPEHPVVSERGNTLWRYDMSGATPLTQEELDYFANDYFSFETHPIAMQFITSLYSRPEDVNLAELFYNGAPNLSGRERPTTEQLIASEGEGFELDTKITGYNVFAPEDVEAVLQAYLGLGADDMSTDLKTLYSYSQTYDMYYHFHGDTNAQSVRLSSGWKDGSDVWLLTEYSSLLHLRRSDGGYLIVSHLHILQPDEKAYFTEDFNGNGVISIAEDYRFTITASPDGDEARVDIAVGSKQAQWTFSTADGDTGALFALEHMGKYCIIYLDSDMTLQLYSFVDRKWTVISSASPVDSGWEDLAAMVEGSIVLADTRDGLVLHRGWPHVLASALTADGK